MEEPEENMKTAISEESSENPTSKEEETEKSEKKTSASSANEMESEETKETSKSYEKEEEKAAEGEKKEEEVEEEISLSELMQEGPRKRNSSRASRETAIVYPQFLKTEDVNVRKMLKSFFHNKRYEERQNFSIDHLFAAFGEWSSYFICVTLWNALMWSLGEIQYYVVSTFMLRGEQTVWHDSNGTRYELIPGHKVYVGTKIGVSVLTMDRIFILGETGQLVGAIASIFMHRFSYRTTVFICSAVYFSPFPLYFIKHLACTTITLFVQTFANKACRIAVILHLTSSLPEHLRPLSMMIIYIMDCVCAAFFFFLLRMMPSWPYILASVAPIYLTAGLLYFYFCPPPILRLVAEKRGEELKHLLQAWGKHETVDPDLIVDSVAFRGPPLTSALETLSHLLFKVWPFSRKLLILTSLVTLHLVARSGASKSQILIANTDPFVNYLSGCMLRAVGSLVCCVLIYSKGRRYALLVFVVLSVVSINTLLILERNEFNFCSVASIPNEIWRAIGAVACWVGIIAARMGIFLIRLMLLEHIPVQQHPYLFPLVMTFSNLLKTTTRVLLSVYVPMMEPLKTIYPHFEYVPMLIFCSLLSLLMVFIDNSSYQPITCGDIACYRRKVTPYAEDPLQDDWRAENGAKVRFSLESVEESSPREL